MRKYTELFLSCDTYKDGKQCHDYISAVLSLSPMLQQIYTHLNKEMIFQLEIS